MKIICPSCEANYSISDSQLGARVKCSKCNNTFEVSAPNGPDPLAKSVEEDTATNLVLKRRNWKEAYGTQTAAEFRSESQAMDAAIKARGARIPVVTTEYYQSKGWSVYETLGHVCSRRVIRTGVTTLNFDTIVGQLSFSWDGGSDSLYQQMEADLLDDLRVQAARSGAAAIVALRFQYGEIEWGSAVFLTGFAQGTLVTLRRVE